MLTTVLFLLGMGIVPCFAADELVPSSPSISDLEAQVVELYSAGHCDRVPALITPTLLAAMRPNVIAVVAACQPDPILAEQIFRFAETRDPHGDLIATLHALYLAPKNREAAQPYWNKVLMYARSESLRDLARESVSGVPPRTTPLNLGSWTWTAQANLGGSHHSSPWVREIPQNLSGGANALDVDLFLRSQSWIRAGSISGVYRLNAHEFPDAKSVSTQVHHLDVPLALRVGVSEDLVFSPFFEHNRVGGKTFSNSGGLGFTGVAYRDSNKQTVSGYAAGEHTLVPNIRSTTQSHYHFDYQWEWFPPRWLLLLKFGIDNFSASRISQIGSVSGDFNQSHNDLALDLTVRRGFDKVSLGLTGSLSSRFDAQESNYKDQITGQSVTEQRADYQIELEPHLIWRPLTQIQLRLYFRQSWVWSNVSMRDYGVDRNHDDSVVGLVLRTYWSSY